jgi:hypothetical protein
MTYIDAIRIDVSETERFPYDDPKGQKGPSAR